MITFRYKSFKETNLSYFIICCKRFMDASKTYVIHRWKYVSLVSEKKFHINVFGQIDFKSVPKPASAS